MTNKLATYLNYPSSLISVGDVDPATGEVKVALLAPTDGSSVNMTEIAEVIDEASNLNSTELSSLGAATVTGETTAPSAAPEDEEMDIAVIAGAAAGGFIFLLIILFIIKKNSSGGTGGVSEDKPMLEVPTQQGGARPADAML